MPQRIPQVLARPGGGVHDFHRKARVSLSLCGVGVPVGLGDLLPHDNIEAAAGLVAKHKSGIVIVPFGVDEEGAAEVHSIKLIITWKVSGARPRLETAAVRRFSIPFPDILVPTGTRSLPGFTFAAFPCRLACCAKNSLLTHGKSGVTVDRLDELFPLMAHHPVRVVLGCPFGVQRDHLEPAEISLTDINVFRTDVIDVWHTVIVKVIFASITSTIT